jgi:OOP family OmpA-OmpF porin
MTNLQKLGTIFLLLLTRFTIGQNLVPNPSFEVFTTCDSLQAGIYLQNASAWDSPTGGTPDLFNVCGTTNWSVPSNLLGYQYPHSGNTYAGAVFCNKSILWREYLQVKLDSSLKNQQKYCVSFFVSLSNNFSIGSNNIAIYFSNTHYTYNNFTGYIINFLPQIIDTNIIIDSLNWTEISGEFIANGGEEYIIIGNFNNNNVFDTTQQTNIIFADDSYYYIDDISVVNCSLSGLSENIIEQIRIYPNPYNDRLNILTNSMEQTTIYLYDLSTRKLFEETFINSTIIDTEKLIDGMYLYTLSDKNGIIKSGKIIKE